MAEFIQIITTCPSKAEAEKVATLLVEMRLAACVQVFGPISSAFWWKGKIDRTQEWMCVVKSTADSYDRIETAIRDHHPYEVPEILVMPVIAGNPDYLDWLRNEVRPQQ